MAEFPICDSKGSHLDSSRSRQHKSISLLAPGPHQLVKQVSIRVVKLPVSPYQIGALTTHLVPCEECLLKGGEPHFVRPLANRAGKSKASEFRRPSQKGDHALAGQLVRARVHLVIRVAFDPAPLDNVRLDSRVKSPP
jgi:hypothetical protein